MTTGGRMPFPRAPWDRILALFGALGVVVFLVLAAVTAIPPVLADRDARVSDGATPLTVGAAQIIVPQGWIVTGDAVQAGIRTPDAALITMVTPTEGAPEEALQRLLRAESGAVPTATVGPLRTETLESGLRIVHTDVGDDAVLSVIADGDRALLGLVSRVGEDFDRADYRASLGLLVAGVRS